MQNKRQRRYKGAIYVCVCVKLDTHIFETHSDFGILENTKSERYVRFTT